MPGFLYHLWFSQEVCARLEAKPDKAFLLAGSLIPDLAEDKQVSHFRIPASRPGFFVPDIARIRKEFDFAIADPERYPMQFGILLHLYLDYIFIERYLLKEYDWDSASHKVTNLSNGRVYDIDFFFSKDGLYKAYAGVTPSDIGLEPKDIPYEIPMTGMVIFDNNRHEKEWLRCYENCNEKRERSVAGILDYERLAKMIPLWADELINVYEK